VADVKYIRLAAVWAVGVAVSAGAVVAQQAASSQQAAATSQPATPPQTGRYPVTFTERSPFSTLGTQHLRYGVDRTTLQVYDTADESFEVYVPPDYRPDEKWGLVVWVSGGGNGGVHPGYVDRLSKKKLIWIAPNNAGNDRGVAVRIGLALDAVWNMKQRYNLDDRRIYAAGVSGGGKVSGMAAMAFPDVFDGAIPCVGMNFYRDIPHPTKPESAWPATFREPPRKVLDEARERVGFVLITGENDPNREPMTAAYNQGFIPAKFKHASLVVVPKMGHQPAPADVFGQAVDTLDAVSRERPEKVQLTLGTTRATDAKQEARSVEAQRMLGLAQSYKSAGRNDRAREMLQNLMDKYPDTEEARVARTMIRNMNNKK
jgi:poly(3-hydroxybutyrate) depolymerase